jgi:hypothetical protein
MSSEEHRLRVYDSRVVRRIFGVGGREVGLEECRGFCSEHHACYSSPVIVIKVIARKIICVWCVACV